jgi:hypothetical protein
MGCNEKERGTMKSEKCGGALTLVLKTAFFIILLPIGSGCSYGFSGGSVPPHLKTIAIPALADQSGYGDPKLRDSFTQALVKEFTSDNTLEITERSTADAALEGIIVDVRDMPAVLEQGEKVSQRRITVTARMTFQDLKLRKKVWEKTFTQWGNYPSGGPLAQRQDAIAEAVRKLTEDILNETVAGW